MEWRSCPQNGKYIRRDVNVYRQRYLLVSGDDDDDDDDDLRRQFRGLMFALTRSYVCVRRKTLQLT